MAMVGSHKAPDRIYNEFIHTEQYNNNLFISYIFHTKQGIFFIYNSLHYNNNIIDMYYVTGKKMLTIVIEM